MSATLEPEIESRLPDRYEVVNGEIVELPPMSTFSAEVANRIQNHLVVYGLSSRLGRPRMDMLFHVPLPADQSRNRRPDVTFISFDRWPADRALPYRGDPADVIPELVVEVASPTDEAEALLAKAHEYLEAGVLLVWLVYPRLRVLYAYESAIRFRVFTATDDLDGGDVLPGFRVPMAQLFPPMIPEPDPPAPDEAD
jgi:Uma2 family endonuclease